MKQVVTKELIGMTVEQAVEELVKRGYTRDEAIRIIKEQYEIETSFGFKEILIHLMSILILISTLYPSELSLIRIVIGFPYITFLPGYAFILAFYKEDRREINNLSKFGLSLGISFAILALIGLFLNFTIGLDQFTIVLSGVLITEIFTILSTVLKVRR